MAGEDLARDLAALEARFQKLEHSLQLLSVQLDTRVAALEKHWHNDGAAAAACDLHVPARCQDGAEPPPEKQEEDEVFDGSDNANVRLAVPVASTKKSKVSFFGAQPKTSLIEPKEALANYNARASVMQRRERGVDEQFLDTATQEYYAFGESTWDLAMFIGTGALGPAGSFQTLILLLTNVFIQGIFVGIAWYNFLVPDLDADTVNDAWRWRRSSAHTLSEYDDVAQMSLAQRVCRGDKSLHISGVQMGLNEDIEKYLKPDATGFEAYFTGQVLCLVALVCWYLMVAKEVSHALALHRGFLAVPRGENKLEPRENPFTQITHFRLVSVTSRRVLGSYILLIYRLFAAALLIYVGTFFLVYTVNVTELILNAVALEIILEIDELIFDALATTPGRHLVHHLEPLPMPSLPRFRGADAKSLSMSVLIPAVTMIIYFVMVVPMVQDLQAVNQALCGGNLAFVWAEDKRRVTLLASTSGDGWNDTEAESIRMRAILEGTSGISAGTNGSQQAAFGVWQSSISALAASSDLSLSLSTLVDMHNAGCEDLATSTPMLNYLRDGLGNESIASCADAAQHCNSVSKMPEWGVDNGRGFLTRMLCSETCGCSDPAGNFILVQGCPFGAGRPCSSSNKLTTALRSATCAEKSAAELRQNEPWTSWVETIRAFGQTSGSLSGQSEALRLAEAMWDHGCAFGQNLTAQNITWGNCFEWNPSFSWDFKTLEYFCPTTCGCDHARTGSLCPTPFGMDCEAIKQCVFVGGTYHCGHNVESSEANQVDVIDGYLLLDVRNPELAMNHKEETELALRQTVANMTGQIPAEGVQIFLEDSPSPFKASFSVFMVFGADTAAITTIMLSKSLAEISAFLAGALQALHLPSEGNVTVLANEIGFGDRPPRLDDYGYG
ncbi:unnamed protein product [Effrenium voratum]|nr:unnamed protein product [Effrenium voratum]